MNLDLHTMHASMDTIQNAADRWMIDNFQDDNDLRSSCSTLCYKCELLHQTLNNFLGDEVDEESDNGSDSEEVC